MIQTTQCHVTTFGSVKVTSKDKSSPWHSPVLEFQRQKNTLLQRMTNKPVAKNDKQTCCKECQTDLLQRMPNRPVAKNAKQTCCKECQTDLLQRMVNRPVAKNDNKTCCKE